MMAAVSLLTEKVERRALYNYHWNSVKSEEFYSLNRQSETRIKHLGLCSLTADCPRKSQVLFFYYWRKLVTIQVMLNLSISCFSIICLSISMIQHIYKITWDITFGIIIKLWLYTPQKSNKTSKTNMTWVFFFKAFDNNSLLSFCLVWRQQRAEKARNSCT